MLAKKKKLFPNPKEQSSTSLIGFKKPFLQERIRFDIGIGSSSQKKALFTKDKKK